MILLVEMMALVDLIFTAILTIFFCIYLDENSKCMVCITGFPDALLTLLGMAPSIVQMKCVQLMLLLSQNAVGRASMVAQFDNIRYVICV